MLLGAKLLHFFETPKCLREFYGLIMISVIICKSAQRSTADLIDSKGLLFPLIGSLSCRPLPPSDNKGRELAGI